MNSLLYKIDKFMGTDDLDKKDKLFYYGVMTLMLVITLMCKVTVG